MATKQKDLLGKRMKEFYEQTSKTKLVRRMPVAIRIDGKAFHTFSRGFKKPFDEILTEAMQETTRYLSKSIQGCVFGYTQSDEITLILVDYKTLETSAWFDYEVQKLCSVSASMATMQFNKIFSKLVDEYTRLKLKDSYTENQNYIKTLYKAVNNGAVFDARCFNIPKEEVCNLVYWRQLDAIRNSTSMIGRAYFSQTELDNMSTTLIIKKLKDIGVDINSFESYKRHGSACYKMEITNNDMIRNEWFIDLNMPLLVKEDRDYLEKYIFI